MYSAPSLYRQTTDCTEGGGLTREHCMFPVCEISDRPINNIYVKSGWSMSNFKNFVYIMYSEVYVK